MELLMQGMVGRFTTTAIHDTVAAIARQRVYAVPLRRSLIGRAFGYLADRFADLLGLLRGSRDFRIVVIAASALIVLAVAGRIIVARQLDVIGRRGRTGVGSRNERRDFWALSRELATSADYVGACHALYAAVIDALARRGSVKFHESKTSGDYARELRRVGSPAVQPFRAFARQFDRAVYGHSTPGGDDYERLAHAAEVVTSVRAAA
jgi:hypothetical protein